MSDANDVFEARLSRYLDWEAGQLTGAPSHVAIAGAIAAPPVERRRGGQPLLVWAAVVMALIVAATAIIIAGRPSQQLVTAPSTAASVTPSAAPETQAPASEPPDPNCLQFDSTGVYTANVGTLPVGVSVPGTPTAPWRGDRDTFFLGKASCAPDTGASPFFLADLVAHVYTDACHWKSTEAEAPTAFAVAEALAAQTGHPTTAPVETQAGAFRATRIDISVPSTFDEATCDDGVMKLYGDRLIVPGMPLQVYVMEIDGSSVVITASYDPARSGLADLQEIDEIIASLRVDM